MVFSKNRKADLSLSINAIVILILAITILGLGLTFVRGLFKQAEQKITEVTSATELANPPTRDSPLTVTPAQMALRQKEVGKILVAYLNDAPDNTECQLSGIHSGGIDVATVLVPSTKVKMKKDSTNVWTLAVKPKKVETGLYTFTMQCFDVLTTPNTPTLIKTTTKDVIVTITQ